MEKFANPKISSSGALLPSRAQHGTTFFARVSPHVHQQIALARELVPAHGAREGLLARVRPRVVDEGGAEAEGHAARRAREGLVAGVDAAVPDQMLPLREPGAAQGAAQGFPPSVALHVPFQVLWAGKAFVALRALDRLAGASRVLLVFVVFGGGGDSLGVRVRSREAARSASLVLSTLAAVIQAAAAPLGRFVFFFVFFFTLDDDIEWPPGPWFGYDKCSDIGGAKTRPCKVQQS